ncbi:hypothetical protein C4E15_14435 [Achromobacter spanius]|uniref:Uncharacterized protein n=1 Tax=Achromobacter spanius TaxID=217203 RepID=A0A2S5GQU2_9BURK|nr:hypothetical protein C4E15_14435 [Achromobacter spanius]
MADQDMAIVIWEESPGRAAPTAEDRVRIQAAAQRAGIPGIVVLVWRFQQGFRYIGPASWATAMEALTWESIHSEADGRLTL